MNWKTKLSKINVGDKVLLRRDSNKSDWQIKPEDHYDKIYKVTKNKYPDESQFILINLNMSNWHMSREFLDKHFQKVN